MHPVCQNYFVELERCDKMKNQESAGSFCVRQGILEESDRFEENRAKNTCSISPLLHRNYFRIIMRFKATGDMTLVSFTVFKLFFCEVSFNNKKQLRTIHWCLSQC